MFSAVSSEAIALHVLQRAALILAHWVNPKFDPPFTRTEKTSVVIQAEKIVGWTEAKLAPLQLVFDQIKLENTQDRQNYRPAWALKLENGEEYPRIPYAQAKPTIDELQSLEGEIQQALPELKNWDNLTQLTMFVEKFGSHLSLGDSDIALIDLARSTAAVAAALAQNPPDQQLVLVAGDLMGVQKFIYTISSEGALKSLRARSFYLELATEEIVQQLLDALRLPRTNIIYAGASKFYLLTAFTESIEQTISQIQQEFNSWLQKKFQRKVFLALDLKKFLASDLAEQFDSQATTTPLSKHWQAVNKKLTAQASRKFAHQLEDLLQLQPSHEPCRVCHRDDTTDLKPLNQREPDSVLACDTCREMFELGDELPDAIALVRWRNSSSQESSKPANADFTIQSSHYRLVKKQPTLKSGETAFLINNWSLKDYASNQFAPLLLGDYYQKSSEGGFISASEMAEKAQGIKRVGYLRMDVDRLSQIFSQGLGSRQTLPRLASLSRQMTYFFKVYLNSLADQRNENFLNYEKQLGFQYLPHKSETKPDKILRKNLLFIYAGGDDLFVSGSWDEVVDFAFDVYQSFRAYTGWHPDITLSAGISITDAKFPLYQAAKEAGDAEDDAKDNGRDSLSLFGQVFKWDHWLGNKAVDDRSKEYLTSEAMPELMGVLPFVKNLIASEALELRYPQSFIRNLLITAQIREQKIKEAQKRQPEQTQAITYYLHLPKLAYALSRLPSQIRAHPQFSPIRQSLMSPRNSPYFRAIATWIELLTR